MSLNNLGLGFVITARDAASAVFKGVEGALGDVDAKAKGSKVKLDEVGAELKNLGTKMMGAGLAGFAGLGMAAHSAAEFQKSVAEVASITDRAAFPMSVIEGIGSDMAKTYGGDLNQQVKALYQAVSSGASTAADATSLLNAANKLAVGGLTDAFTAVDALTNVLNAYNMKLSDSQDVTDAFFTTIKVGKTTAEELAHSIGQVAPTAALAGVKMDELMGSIAAGSTQIGNATQTITGMKAMLSGILKPTTDAAAEAKRLGISFDAASLKSMGFVKFMQQFNNVSGKMKPDSLAKLFGSVEAMNLAGILTANGGAALNNAMGEMDKRAGATDAAFKTLSQTAAFLGSVLMANVQIALKDIGSIVAPVIGLIMQGINGLVVAFNALPRPVKQILVAVVALVSGFLVLAGAAVFIAGSIAMLAGVGEAVGIALAIAAGITYQLGVAFAFVAALAAGFAAALEGDIGGIGSAFREWGGQIRLVFDGIQQLFTDGGFSGAVRDEMNKAGNEGLRDFAVQIAMIAGRIENFFSGIKSGMSEGLGQLGPTFQELRAAVVELAGAFGFAKDGVTDSAKAFDQYGSTGKTIGGALATVFGLIVQGVTAAVNIGRSFVAGFTAMGPATGTLRAAVMSLFTALGGLVTTLGQAAGASGSTGGPFETMANILGKVVGAIAMVVTGVTYLIGFFATGIGAGLSGLITIVSGVMDVFSGIVNMTMGALTGNWDQAWMGMKQVVLGVVKAVVGALMAMVSQIAMVLDMMGKLAGKDLGLQKKVEGLKADMVKGMTAGMGLDKPKAEVSDQKPILQLKPSGPGGAKMEPISAAEAGANQQGARPAADAAAAQAAQAPAMADLMAKMSAPQPQPPITLNNTTTLTVDGQTLANIVEQHQTSNGNRSFGAAPAPG